HRGRRGLIQCRHCEMSSTASGSTTEDILRLRSGRALVHEGNHISFRSAMCKILILFLSLLLVSPAGFAQGRVECSTFSSHILNRAVHYCVMLPAQYEREGQKKYPVLYFLHGLGENEQALLRSGGWGLIGDLRREHRIGDFLIV